jgi:hypothetical protein
MGKIASNTNSMKSNGTNAPFINPKHSINMLQTQHLSYEQFNEMNPAAMSVLHESQVFQRRLHNLTRKLDAEVEPFKPVSKDHFRTNKNGINIDRGNPFKKERKSMDIAASRNMNKGIQHHLSHRKISRPDVDSLNQTMQPTRNLPAAINTSHTIT